MNTFSVDSFSSFVNVVEQWNVSHSKVLLFRGQGRRRGLVPGIGRDLHLTPPALAKLERTLNAQFRLQGAAHLPDESGWLERLVLAQHFGLRTRLLDWTSNPLVALWFACSARSDSDVYLYAFDPGERLIEDPYSLEESERLEVGAFQPRLSNPRVIAQQGWFTLHPISEATRPLENTLAGTNAILEFRIYGHVRESILSTLNRNGINERTLFPGLDGICQYLNWNIFTSQMPRFRVRSSVDQVTEVLERNGIVVSDGVPLPPPALPHVWLHDSPSAGLVISTNEYWAPQLFPTIIGAFGATASFDHASPSQLRITYHGVSVDFSNI